MRDIIFFHLDRDKFMQISVIFEMYSIYKSGFPSLNNLLLIIKDKFLLHINLVPKFIY